MITGIKLKNFKCFEDETIELTPLNLWAGLNGMGKSTVIQALLLLRQNYELGLLQKDEGLSLNGEFVRIGNSKDLLYQYFKDQQIGIEITVDGASKVEWKWDAGPNIDNLPFIDKQGDPGLIFKTALFGSDFHYLNAERLGPRVYFETASYDVIKRNRLGWRGEGQ